MNITQYGALGKRLHLTLQIDLSSQFQSLSPLDPQNQVGFMEENNNSSDQSINDGIRIPVQHIIDSRKRKHTQSKAIAMTAPAKMNPNSESSAQSIVFDIHNLPDPLILEILARLPLKSIFRFKCVCKHWLSLISHPSFCRFYLSRSCLPFRILYRYVYVSKFKEILNRFGPEICNSSEFSVLFLSRFEEQQRADQFKVLAVSNGLILCCLLAPLVYYVCDPVTSQWVTLPRPKDKSPDLHRIFFGEGLVSRVNEDNVLMSYTVSRVELLNSPSMYLTIQTFSSETGQWVDYKLPCSNPVRLLKRGGGPICFNGILHWFVRDYGMVAFDPYEDPKSCRLIPFPEDKDVESEYKHDGLYRLCDVCQGKLRFFEAAPEACGFYCFSMWELRDYEKGEWHCEFKVTRNNLSSDDPELNSWLMQATFLPLSFHPFDSDVVYLRCVELGCIVSYNIQNRRLDVACKPIGIVEDLSWRVVVPFVLPKWPTPVPIPPNRKKGVKQKPARQHH